jgi:hypothetical protein
MADVREIHQVVTALIESLDKTSSPNDIIEAFDDALEIYEQQIQTSYKN